MKQIYIVEDDHSIAEIESFALQNAGFSVETFPCATDFYGRLEEKKPDLLILDIMLPDEDGLTILGKIREQKETRELPVMMITAKTMEIDKVKGLDMGADDYLVKPFGVMELISRVKALLRRTKKQEEQTVFICGGIMLDDEKHLVQAGEKACDLTFKEYELLKLLLAKEGAVVSREQILKQVWGVDFEGESRTLDMHIKTLRHKLGEEGDAIKTVRNVGYILSKE